MRRQIELCKVVQASCPGTPHQDIQEMALACMGETPSAPSVAGGSSSSATTVSMTPVGPAHPPRFPPPQQMADDQEGSMQTSPGPGMKGLTTTKVPVTTVTMPRIVVSIIKVTEVPGGKVVKGATSWLE